MGIPHFLAIPYPILGHMNPLLQFSQVLAKHGCKITFLSSEENFSKLKSAFDDDGGLIMEPKMMRLVSLPDGVGPEDDRNDQPKVIMSTRTTMVAMLPKLIEDINGEDGQNKITCIIVTKNMGWALEVGKRLGIEGALFWPASATSLASFDSMQRLVDEGIIHSENGLPTRKNNEIQLSSKLPMMEAAAMPWYCLDNTFFFLHMKQEMQTLNLAKWWLCNTTIDLEHGAFSISPKLLPIGPLIESDDQHNNNTSSLTWQEDTTCLHWLDQQQPQSVIYVSFGSMVSTKPNQFKELALGLDLLNKPFLWVVRSSNNSNSNNVSINAYPDKFTGNRGKIVCWVPQKKVLSHPAIACFVSHCGWNSTMEGLYSGVPFLCWPFCSDQLMNKTYICDVWKVGMGFDKDENSGLISRGEIKKKVDLVLGGDEGIRGRCLKMKEMVIKNKGEGDKNLKEFIIWARNK